MASTYPLDGRMKNWTPFDAWFAESSVGSVGLSVRSPAMPDVNVPMIEFTKTVEFTALLLAGRSGVLKYRYS